MSHPSITRRRVFVMDAAALAPDELHPVSVAGRELVLCTVEGQLCAFDDACPHMNWPLSYGFLEDGVVYCSLHMASFDPCSGRCLGPPADRSLTLYEVEEDGGALYVIIDEEE